MARPPPLRSQNFRRFQDRLEGDDSAVLAHQFRQPQGVVSDVGAKVQHPIAGPDPLCQTAELRLIGN
jgi:hypothetical protein